MGASLDNFRELFKMGGSVSCQADIGKITEVKIQMTRNACQPVLCNVGIFANTYGDIDANRDDSVFQFTNFNIEGLIVSIDASQQVLTTNLEAKFPQITGTCKACSIIMQLTYDDEES